MKRQIARENAFLLLFEGVANKDEGVKEIFDVATTERELEYDSYVEGVYFGVYENLAEIDGIIAECSVGWKSERISNVSRAAIRLAIYELLFLEDIPTKVSINEAIELSKRFDDEKAYLFVNGVLNRAAEKLGKK